MIDDRKAGQPEEEVTVISALPESASKPSGSNVRIVERPNVRRNWKRTLGISSGIVMCLCFMAAGTLFGHFYWGSPQIRQLFNDHAIQAVNDWAHGRGFDYQWRPEIQFPSSTSINLLVMGVDHDYDNKDQIIWSSPGRSDSILLARVDFINKTIDALTIPRDTAVHIPGHNGIHKINAAHNFGGPELSMETIKSVFGVDVDKYVEVNFEGFQEIVNAIGGIDIDVQKKLDYDDNWGNLHIHLKPGYQHLDGYRAMGFVRMRHSDSDEMRSKRQHEFLEAMRTKVKNPTTLGKLPTLINKIDKHLKRNMTDDQLLALVNFARSIPKENVVLKTLPSFEGPSYVTVDQEKSAKVIQEMFFPNQYVSMNIDAPDPNDVRSMNSRYDRGSRRGAHRRSKKSEAAEDAPQPPPVVERQPLSVEDNPGETGHAKGAVEPSTPPTGQSGDAPGVESKTDKGAGTKS